MRLRIRSHVRQHLIQAVVPAYAVACIILGGASAAGHLANMLLQLLALPLIWLAIMYPQSVPPSRYARQLILLAGLLIALFLIGLIPLPPSLWAGLPGREVIARGYSALGMPLPWLPLSLAPGQTVASLLWLLPAFATLLAMLRLGAFNLRWFVWALVGMAAVSVILGAIQIAGGTASPAYFYHFTNRGVAVGFFANTNHLAAMLLITIPLLSAELARARAARVNRKQASALIVAIAASLVVAVVGLIITRSLAGIGLLIPVGAASALLVLSGKGRPTRWALPAILALLVVTVGVAMSEPFGNNLTGQQAKSEEQSRYTIYSTTLAAAREYLPVGSGIGTFIDVYRTQENPAEVGRTYVNHAHSDPIEFLLETGVAGIALLALFLLWWGWRTVSIWLSDERDPYAAAATIATGAVIAHSCVDYPLRTAAVAVLFTVCLAIMAKPRERTIVRQREGEGSARHLAA